MERACSILYEKERILASIDIVRKLEALDIPFKKTSKGLILFIPFIDEKITISIPSFSFKSEKKRPIKRSERILLLNYLIYAEEKPLLGKWADFEGLFGKKEKEILKTLTHLITEEKSLFKKAIIKLGAKEIEPFSYLIYIFPKLPVLFRVHNDPRIFFDSLFENYKERADLLSLTKILSRKILKEAKILYEEADF